MSTLNDYLNSIIDYLCEIPMPENNCFGLEGVHTLHTVIYNIVNSICEYPPQPLQIFYCHVDFDKIKSHTEIEIDISNIFNEVLSIYPNLTSDHLNAFCTVELKSFVVPSYGYDWKYYTDNNDTRQWSSPAPDIDFIPDLGGYAFCRYHTSYPYYGAYNSAEKKFVFSIGPQGLIHADPENSTFAAQDWLVANSATQILPDSFIKNDYSRAVASYRIHIFAGYNGDLISFNAAHIT